jgi:hypothetical protein
MFVDDGQLVAASGQVQAADGRADLQDVHGERIVDEDFQNLAIFEAQQQTFPLRRPSDYL